MLSFVNLSMSAQPKKNVDFQGHRGCRGLYPENTLRAMVEALKLGVTTLEMDVVITKDKQVVLSHEPFMAHEIATSPEGSYLNVGNEKIFNIYQMDYVELKKWDVGLKPHPRFPSQYKIPAQKPLLSEVIDSVEHYISQHGLQPVQYNIETKSEPDGDDIFHPKPQEFVSLLMNVLREKKVLDRVIIQSFDKRTIQIIHRQRIPVKLSYLLEDSDISTVANQIKALGFKPDIISPEFSKIDAAYVKYCHRRKMKVIPWTVNDSTEISRLLAAGVDGIISDYPNLFESIK
ncbi:MAG: hypothetical protein RLZ47_984 [Bacteroidota bacterium]